MAANSAGKSEYSSSAGLSRATGESPLYSFDRLIGGQDVIVIPELDLVVAVCASNYGDRVSLDIQNSIVPLQVLPAVH